jgi:hypothetical protein
MPPTKPISPDARSAAQKLKATPQFFMDLTVDWTEAWKTRDRKKLDELVAEEFCFISRRVKNMCVGREEWLRMVTEQYKLEKYEIDFITVNVQQYAAIVVYRFSVMARPNHTNLPEEYIVTDAWTLNGKRWQAISRELLVI